MSGTAPLPPEPVGPAQPVGARGLAVYADVLATPGAKVFVAAGLLARLPISMLGIGIVVLVQAGYGSYRAAGAVAAVYALVSSVCSPLVARAVDRHGQARVMRPAIAVHLVGLSALVVLASVGAPVVLVAAAAVVMGTTVGSVGALVRARWAFVLDPARLSTAFSLESVLDEVVFATGPVLVTVLATALWPPAGLVLAAVAAGAGGAVLLAQRSTEPPATCAAPRRGSAVLASPGMPVVLLVFAAAGAVFGSVEVVTVAYTQARGVGWSAGLVLAVYALGSLLAGLAYGTVAWRASAGRRFAVGALGFAAGVGLLALVRAIDALDSVVVVGALLFVGGSAISPTLIAGNALVRELVAPSRLTEGLTWVSTSLGLGVAAGRRAGGLLGAGGRGAHGAGAAGAVRGRRRGRGRRRVAQHRARARRRPTLSEAATAHAAMTSR